LAENSRFNMEQQYKCTTAKKDGSHRLGLDSISMYFSQVVEWFNTNVGVLADLNYTVVSIDTDKSTHVAFPVTLQDHHVVLLLRLDTVQHVARQENNFTSEGDHATAVCGRDDFANETFLTFELAALEAIVSSDFESL
jgi:hypothetical protein